MAAEAGLGVMVVGPSLAPLPPGACPTARVEAQGDTAGTQLVRGTTVQLTVNCTAAVISPSP